MWQNPLPALIKSQPLFAIRFAGSMLSITRKRIPKGNKTIALSNGADKERIPLQAPKIIQPKEPRLRARFFFDCFFAVFSGYLMLLDAQIKATFLSVPHSYHFLVSDRLLPCSCKKWTGQRSQESGYTMLTSCVSLVIIALSQFNRKRKRLSNV